MSSLAHEPSTADGIAAAFSPGNTTLRHDPWSVYRRFRQDRPVAWLPALNSFAVFTHDTVHSVLSDRGFTAEQQFRSSRRAVGPTILDVEDPEHRQLRHVVHPPLGLSSVRANRPALREVVDRLLDGLPVGVPIDLMAEVADVLPMLVVCHMLGLPTSAARWLAATSRPIADYLDESGTSLAVARSRRSELVDFLDEHFLAATHNDSTLGGELLAAFRDGRLSRRATRDNLVMLLVVGTVTTVCGSGNTLACLLSEPDRYHRLVTGELSVPEVVAESLRHQPPVHFVPRFCREDTELGGVRLPRGSSVHVCVASANRDGAVFDDPDTWRPGRTDSRHTFVFGYGRHGCVGGLLGEAEIVELVAALVRRWPGLRAHEPVGDPTGWVFRRPERLLAVADGTRP